MSDNNPIDQWVRRLTEEEMPVFARTAQTVAGLSTNNDASVAELVRAVLQDSSMTARVLKAANSAYFGGGRAHVNTVSRAVVVLGFEAVRSLAFSVALVEALVEGPRRAWALREMARAFHAALQAKGFAAKTGDISPEEAYTAALLYRIGHLAFWCFAGEEAEVLDNAMRRPGYSPARAEEEVLGFRLDHLSSRLTQEWNLGGVLREALEKGKLASGYARSVIMAHELARTVEGGWETPALNPLLVRLEEVLKLPESVVVDLVHKSAKAAADTAQATGLQGAGRLIPAPPDLDKWRVIRANEGGEEPSEESFLKPDLALQMRILRELSSMMEGRPDLNVLLSMVLEGIYRGIGMDRTLFALLTPDRYFMKSKYALGWMNPAQVKGFYFQVQPPRPHVFSHALKQRRPVWMPKDPPTELKELLTPEILAVTNGTAFFVMPIVVDDQAIGLFYADRHPSGRELDEESFASFQHFGREANLALSFISLRGKQK